MAYEWNDIPSVDWVTGGRKPRTPPGYNKYIKSCFAQYPDVMHAPGVPLYGRWWIMWWRIVPDAYSPSVHEISAKLGSSPYCLKRNGKEGEYTQAIVDGVYYPKFCAPDKPRVAREQAKLDGEYNPKQKRKKLVYGKDRLHFDVELGMSLTDEDKLLLS
jgi:hypothetical protein